MSEKKANGKFTFHPLDRKGVENENISAGGRCKPNNKTELFEKSLGKVTELDVSSVRCCNTTVRNKRSNTCSG